MRTKRKKCNIIVYTGCIQAHFSAWDSCVLAEPGAHYKITVIMHLRWKKIDSKPQILLALKQSISVHLQPLHVNCQLLIRHGIKSKIFHIRDHY